jgi:ABC-type uncharacterized transport system YnjBCD ATPase subunit
MARKSAVNHGFPKGPGFFTDFRRVVSGWRKTRVAWCRTLMLAAPTGILLQTSDWVMGTAWLENRKRHC